MAPGFSQSKNDADSVGEAIKIFGMSFFYKDAVRNPANKPKITRYSVYLFLRRM